MKHLRFLILIPALLLSAFVSGCGSQSIVTAPPAPVLSDFTPSALVLGSPYPVDIDIVDQPDLKNTLFVTTNTAVLAFDLDTMQPSTTIVGLPALPAEASSGFPNNLEVIDSTHALLLTSDSLIYFCPLDGTVFESVTILDPIALSEPLKQIQGDGTPIADLTDTLIPSFPASVLQIEGKKVAVSFSNITYAPDFSSIDHITQGIVRYFDLNSSAPYLTSATPSYAVLTGFNATGLTRLSDGSFLATSSGATVLNASFQSIPVTSARLDHLSFESHLPIESALDLGLSAPAFRSWAVKKDQSRAYIGSSSGGYVLAVGLHPFQVLRGDADPLVVTSAEDGTDYLNEVLLNASESGLFTSSSNHSSVYGFDLTGAEPLLLPQIIDLSFSNNPGITGAGPMVFRPGSPGVDFEGPDLFVLTANPGTVAAIKTY